MEGKKFLNDDQVADYLCVSKSWVRQSRVKGNGPQFYRIGGAVRYLLADIDAWAASHVATKTLGIGQGGRR